MRVSASVGGEMKPLIVSAAGAADMAKPADAKMRKSAVAETKRRARERGGGVGGGVCCDEGGWLVSLAMVS